MNWDNSYRLQLYIHLCNYINITNVNTQFCNITKVININILHL